MVIGRVIKRKSAKITQGSQNEFLMIKNTRQTAMQMFTRYRQCVKFVHHRHRLRRRLNLVVLVNHLVLECESHLETCGVS